MDAIQEPNKEFVFSKLILSPPVAISSGNHFIKFSSNGNPLYTQLPKCSIKYGVMKTGKRMFCDLIFSIDNEELTQWLENLENHCQGCIYEKREHWFETALEKHDIENSFFSPIKLIKSGKYFTLRANIPMILGKPSLKIYDESEQLLDLEDLKEDLTAISILEFKGIKCSPRGFQIEIEIKQLLVLKPEDIFQKCVLFTKSSASKPQKDMTAVKGEHVVENLKNSSTDDQVFLEPQSCFVKRSNDEVSIDLKQECNKDDQSGLKIENFLTEAPHIVDKCHTIQLTEEEDMLPCETILEDTQNNHVVINEDLTTPLVTYKYTNDEMKDQGRTEPDENKTNLTEIDFNLEEIPHEESLVLKKRNDVYYEMYRDALSKAKMAKEMAITNYLEAKRIKNLYMLEDLSDNESDNESESDYE
jgi:hypothetical protein